MSLQDAYTYKQVYPDHADDVIGFTSFSHLAPPNVKKLSETSCRQCMCQLCYNPALKAEALKKFTERNKKIKTCKCDIINTTLCPYNTKYRRAVCLHRTCSQCRPGALAKYYKDSIVSCKDQQKEIQWCKWEYITVRKDDTNKRIMSCVPQTTTLGTFLNSLMSVRVFTRIVSDNP